MRTTLVISDELLASAKRAAAERRCSLSAVVEDALRLALKPDGRQTGGGPRFQIPVFHGEGPVTDTTPAELANLRDDEDLLPWLK